MAYQKHPSEVGIVIFQNNFKKSDKEPTHVVKITMPDGTEVEGGLWTRTSQNGNKFLSGYARPKDNNYKPQPRERVENNAVEINF